jgi:hypothetical protein
MLFLDVLGFFDHAASCSGSRFCRLRQMLPSTMQTVSARGSPVIGLYSPARRCLYLRFAVPLATYCARFSSTGSTMYVSSLAASSVSTAHDVFRDTASPANPHGSAIKMAIAPPNASPMN